MYKLLNPTALIKSKSRREPYNTVGRLSRRIYICELDGLVAIPENLAVCCSQYARNKAITGSIQKTGNFLIVPLFGPISYAFKNQIRLIKFSVAT